VKEMMTNASAGYNKDHEQCKFDKSRYGNPEDFTGSEKPTREKLITYLHDKKLGGIQQSSAWDTSTGGSSPKTNEGGFSDHLKANWYWYAGGGLILIIALVFIVFWKSISGWWNGPAEEEGARAEEGEEKDEETEK